MADTLTKVSATFFYVFLGSRRKCRTFANMNTTYRDIKTELTSKGMDEGEAKAIALLLMEKVCGMNVTEVLTGCDDTTRTPQEQQALDMAAQVAQGTPVQYVLGEADFCGLTFHVAPGVLIPRPETEELVAGVVKELGMREEESGIRILDVGTGSGCIAVALAKRLEKAEVEAWDISEEALRVAKENAALNGVNVMVKQVDVLRDNGQRTTDNRGRTTDNGQRTTDNGQQRTDNGQFDVVVSNPPYICEEEQEEMERNVLEHEPGLALFVPNDDPLLFYRRIGGLGLQLLKDGGMLFFEINRRFGKETVELLQGIGYQEVELRKDTFGNDRMVKAIKK